jgi:hypothetical protein
MDPSLTSVHFLVHRFTTDVEELDEQALARLIPSGTTDLEEIDEQVLARLFDSDSDLVAALCEHEEIEGALAIGDASILDDLSSATQRLCFEAVERLVATGTRYEYLYLTSNAHAVLVSSADGATITLSGEYLPTREFSRGELLAALYACGLRYLAFLEDLGRRGRTWSVTDLAHLRPFADHARAALIAHGIHPPGGGSVAAAT